MTETNKYARGKIYKIVCGTTGLQYVGSTITLLSKRLTEHRADYRMWLKKTGAYVSSFEILKNDNYSIELIELFPCFNNVELLTREKYWKSTLVCVNINNPIRTVEERRSLCKQYYTENRDKMLEQKKVYRVENREKMLELYKAYYVANREKIKESRKMCYQRKKDAALPVK